MKIGILQTGRVPDELKAIYSDYDRFFERFLDGRGFTFETYTVLDGHLPDGPEAAEGWLITGSKFGVYEPHPWIPPLEEFLRACYAAEVPIVGICFGHQILAQALGGKVVKFSGGWSVGPTLYDGPVLGPQMLNAWHQDQVVELPEGAVCIGSSEVCENAILVYGDRAFTIQPHPEFTAGFTADLLEARRETLPPEAAHDAEHRLQTPTASGDVADLIARFFKTRSLT